MFAAPSANSHTPHRSRTFILAQTHTRARAHLQAKGGEAERDAKTCRCRRRRILHPAAAGCKNKRIRYSAPSLPHTGGSDGGYSRCGAPVSAPRLRSCVLTALSIQPPSLRTLPPVLSSAPLFPAEVDLASLALLPLSVCLSLFLSLSSPSSPPPLTLHPWRQMRYEVKDACSKNI